MTEIWVDTRWEGLHGIGRYAREVCSRLTVPWRSLGLAGSPASPTGALARVPSGLVYSPGYNAFRRAERQVLTVHDLIHLETPWPGRAKYLAYYNAIVKPVLKRSGVVITVSETSRRAIAAWLNDSSVEIVNAGLGASPTFRTDVMPAVAKDPYLMYVGNLREHKNITVVLDAMTRVPSSRMRLLIPSNEHSEANRLFAARGLSERVELLAGLSDEELASHYRGAAATVMPSTLEGFGLPALESVMTGTPVLYWHGCSAVAETVGKRGQAIVGAHDVEEWGEAIEDALAGPQRVEPPARAYGWSATAAIVNDVLVAHND
ncbi:glycosyltransferase family 4 protein [Microbacterium gubbeenense]|uniref:glycosyltransferase family 4 protein n=1 Tax=Microbacterium gubbeenense TaxID=159896 RepID=UPI0003FB9884|nr:glycosyltransferase family 1 protein [Microbacterium gubbeenense]